MFLALENQLQSTELQLNRRFPAKGPLSPSTLNRIPEDLYVLRYSLRGVGEASNLIPQFPGFNRRVPGKFRFTEGFDNFVQWFKIDQPVCDTPLYLFPNQPQPLFRKQLPVPHLRGSIKVHPISDVRGERSRIDAGGVRYLIRQV